MGIKISHKAVVHIVLSVIMGRSRRMAGKKEAQKTVAFRLNIAKEEERELYHAIMKHGRGRENDIYGSSGAYVKAALSYYHRQESKLELQEQYQQEMRSYLKELAEEQGEVFLEKLSEHDKELAVTVAEAVMRAVGSIKVSGIGTNEGQGIGDFGKQPAVNLAENVSVGGTELQQSMSMEEIGTEEGLPEEALLYLSNL